ncbi:unnamed protein product [Caenorhabditis angaria]|uniref:Uncharacterized protein n=1 Tax=Caenorhabditis angaria TaxID=860376 RepID=A0A9P1I6B4_9PELO|nr:unnamed protein product [Caenorhabditis angaria]
MIQNQSNNYSILDTSSPISTNFYYQQNPQDDLLTLCKELATSFQSSGKHQQTARNIIQKIVRNRNFDLCSITPPVFVGANSDLHLFNVIYELIYAYSPFFNTVIEDSQLVDELWEALIWQIENSRMNTQIVRESVLLNVIATYITRLLPCDEIVPQMSMRSPNTSKTHQIIQTPLQLFKPTSPLVNRMNIDDRTELVSTSNANFQPRHVNYFNLLINKICTTDVYPNANRFLLLRYLLKQFHVFCLHETVDEYVDSVKNQMMCDPPFSPALFQFFVNSLNHCPTVSLFKDICMCWLTYCRPWRYLQTLPNTSANFPQDYSLVSRFLPFVRKNFDYYRFLLGKIIKKFSSFDVNLELISSMRGIIEFSWKDPQFVLLKNVQLNIEPHVVELLEHMKTELISRKNAVKMEMASTSSSFLDSFFGTGISEKSDESVKIIKEIETMIGDCDKYLGTKILTNVGENLAKNETNRSEIMNEDVNRISMDTPKSSLLPDHFIDQKTNQMILTPRGQKQVLTGERRFDPSKYIKSSAYSLVSKNESEILVRAMTWLAEKSTNIPGVSTLADNYNCQNLLGLIARVVMYPPVPNLDPKAAAPCYSPRVRRTPPLLRLRIFANFFVISLIFYLILAQHFGLVFFVLPTLFIGIIGLFLILAMDSV